MSYIPADTNLKGTAMPFRRRGWGSFACSFLCTVLFLLVSAISLVAQQGRWEYQVVSSGTYDRLDPRVAIDRWGNSHVMWAAVDSVTSTRQLFYSSDVTGIFHAPLRVTDNREVVDPAASYQTSSVFNLDPLGGPHIAFPAVSDADPGSAIFHASQSAANRDFGTHYPVADDSILQYDMAVDSLGYAHIVWVRYDGELVNFHYWTSRQPSVPVTIPAFPCVPGAGRCRVGNPEIEVGPNGIVIAFRSDYGSLYMITQQRGNFLPAIKVDAEGIPVYDVFLTQINKADLRLRIAVDNAGKIHFLYPDYNELEKHRIVHTTNASGPWVTSKPSILSFDTAVADFDIAYNGVDRVCAVWTLRPTNGRPGGSVIGFAELVRPETISDWERTPDLNKTLGDSSIWSDAVRIAAVGGRVVIAGARQVSASAPDEIVLIVRSSTRPEIRYILPDAAAPGMNVVVDAFAHVRKPGSFGPDGFHFDGVTMEVVNSSDAGKLVFGPSVVSWDGRLVSTMVFVTPDAPAGPVPVRLRIRHGAQETTSTVDTFFIVQPVAGAGELKNGGVIGSAGLGLGRRSKRGVLVVNSLHLEALTFTVDTSDTDPLTPGNQGFLPVTILSRGPIVIDTLATLSVSARHDTSDRSRPRYSDAGPGGGGGGSGGFYLGGAGFTGGGGGMMYSIIDSVPGSGGRRSARWSSGPALTGAPGGAGFPDVAGGGGTGHPFGAAGAFARSSSRTPVDVNPGGYGGGSAGSRPIPGAPGPVGGGGGGHASLGLNGGGVVNGNGNGGHPVGSPQLVPLSGGSGGGGGYAQDGYASGGGGGGAIALFSRGDIIINGNIEADGAPGVNPSRASNSSGGGGGAGGAILLASQGEIKYGSSGELSALGKSGGAGGAGASGGSGGVGRIRNDGRYPSPPLQSRPAITSHGPAIALTPDIMSGNQVEISGAAATGSTITVYVRTKEGQWEYGTPYTVTTSGNAPGDFNGTWRVKLREMPATEQLYVVAMQSVVNPQREEFQNSPDWVMSHASGIIIGQPVVGVDADSVIFPCVNFDSCVTAEIPVRNLGSVADLVISDAQIVVDPGGSGSVFTLVSQSSARVAPQGIAMLKVSFCPGDIGRFTARLRFKTNLRNADSVMELQLVGCGVSGRVVAIQPVIDLGEICPEECRSTIIPLRNRGEGILTIRGIVSRGDAIGVRVGIPLPVEIMPGSSLDIPVRLCPKRIDQRGSWLDIQANSVYPIDAIMVRGTNIGPEFDIPESVSFGSILIKEGGENCIQRTVIIRNLKERDQLKLNSLVLTGGTKFTVTPSPIADISIGQQPLVLNVRFCSDEPGDFTDTIRMMFGGGECLVDTVIVLRGSAALPAPSFVIEHPAYDTVSQCRTIRFPVTSVNGVSRKDRIVIRNLGTATGWAQWEWVDRDDDFVISSITDSMEIGERLELAVEYRPGTTGPSTARIRFTSGDGRWSEIVCLYGTGAEPGIRFLVTDEIQFGDVRVGSSVQDSLALYNDGDIAVTFTDITDLIGQQPLGTFDFIGFTVNGAKQDLPITLEPDDTTKLWLHYTFNPQIPDNDERVMREELTTLDGRKIPFRLRGRGVLGRIATDTRVIGFTCLPGGEISRKCFMLYNKGTDPLEVLQVFVNGPARTRFTVIPPGPAPVVIAPGDSLEYCLDYAAGADDVLGQLVVEVSMPKQYEYERFLRIDLIGDGCGVSDEQKITFSIADTSYMLGDTFYLPIQVELAVPTSGNLLYAFELNYAYDLLFPVGVPDTASVELEETMSNFVAQYFEEKPGQLLIAGELREGSTKGTLLKIPFMVLLGSRYNTRISIKDITIAINEVSDSEGMFYMLDADTSNGGVVLLSSYRLGANQPNPFRGTTDIPYKIGKKGNVRLNLYNSVGTLVRVLIDEEKEAGEYTYTLDAGTLPSGTYTYEIISGRFRKTRQMVLAE